MPYPQHEKQWICSKIGIDSIDEISCILHFSIYWNIYENKFFSSSFDALLINGILANTSLFPDRAELHRHTSEILSYFKMRYVSSNSLNSKFRTLNIRNREDPALVENVLLENVSAQDLEFKAVQTIISRFRNNLFHGLKSPDEIREQNDVFSHINKYIGFMIDAQ